MAAAMKFFFVIVAIACCMQLVEMHRLRRDESAVATTPDIAKTLEALLGSIKENIENSAIFNDISEKIKNINPDDAKELLEKVTTSVKENLGKTETFVKETLEKFNSEVAPAKTD